MRALVVAIVGFVLLAVGIGMEAAEASHASICSTQIGNSVLSVQTCDQANAISGVGLVLIVIGGIMFVTGLVLAIVRLTRQPRNHNR